MRKNNQFQYRIQKIIATIKNLPKTFFSINLSHNTGTKIFSLLLAVLFWLFVMDQVDPEITKVFANVPVEIINQQVLDQNDLMIMDQHDYFVNVEVSGRRNVVLDLKSSSIYLWIDVQNVNKGSNVLQINKTINSEQASIQTLIPNEIVLNVEQVISIPKPIKISTTGSFPNNLYQQQASISPEEVKVTGPESLVNSVSYLGGTVNVSNVYENITKQVSLVPYDLDGNIVSGVSVEENYTNYSINVGMKKEVTITPVIVGEPYEGFEVVSINVLPETLTLSGQESLVTNISEISPEAITLNGMETSSFIVEKDLVLPDGVTSSAENDKVQIEVNIEQVITKEFNYNIADIPIVNLQDNLAVDLTKQTGNIKIKIKDIESVLQDISKEDINLSINFGIVDNPGLYRLKINVAEADLYRQLSVDPSYLEVEVVNKTE